MKSIINKLSLLLLLTMLCSLTSMANRCESAGNVEVSASAYSGTVGSITYTFHNYNTEKVTVTADYTIVSTSGEKIETSRIYVIEGGKEKTEKFTSKMFETNGLIKANSCGVRISVQICK